MISQVQMYGKFNQFLSSLTVLYFPTKEDHALPYIKPFFRESNVALASEVWSAELSITEL